MPHHTPLVWLLKAFGQRRRSPYPPDYPPRLRAISHAAWYESSAFVCQDSGTSEPSNPHWAGCSQNDEKTMQTHHASIPSDVLPSSLYLFYCCFPFRGFAFKCQSNAWTAAAANSDSERSRQRLQSPRMSFSHRKLQFFCFLFRTRRSCRLTRRSYGF